MNEQKLEIFNVLNFLNKGYELGDILSEGQFGTFSSAEECVHYLIDEGYFEKERSADGGEEVTADEVSKKYTVAELKDILRENDLKVSGKKQELVERALPVLNTGKYEPVMFNLKFTNKAREFLKENEWIDLYMFALVCFRFEDYENYVNQSSWGNVETALKFCDEIISRALVRNQFTVFIDTLYAKAHVYAYDGDYESFIDYYLQRFILGLNPMVMDEITFEDYEFINETSIANLRLVLEKLEIGSLKKRFDRIWDKSHIKHVNVPKKSAFKTLKKALDGADIEELNLKLNERFINNNYGI